MTILFSYTTKMFRIAWEILSKGESPYLGLDNTQVALQVCKGRRLDIPESCPTDLG
jgi:hypothetical protein